jgi:hypothetical protein
VAALACISLVTELAKVRKCCSRFFYKSPITKYFNTATFVILAVSGAGGGALLLGQAGDARLL